MSLIITICARGGSQGVPQKNIRILCGKPLIVHTIEQALSIEGVQGVYVSTDDAAIAEIARRAGAQIPFIRPAELATSDAGKVPVIQHMVQFLEHSGLTISRILDLDPTSPLRTVSDIQACLQLLDESTDVVITGYESDKNPYFNMVEQKSGGYFERVCPPPSEVVTRQSAPKVFAMNASIYAWQRKSLSTSLWSSPRIRLHVMPRERSVDIDHEVDFEIVEMLMKKLTDVR